MERARRRRRHDLDRPLRKHLEFNNSIGYPILNQTYHEGKKREWYFSGESSNSSKFDYKVWYAITNIGYGREEIQLVEVQNSIPTKLITDSEMHDTSHTFM